MKVSKVILFATIALGAQVAGAAVSCKDSVHRPLTQSNAPHHQVVASLDARKAAPSVAVPNSTGAHR